MNNAMQLKAKIKNISKEKNISPQLVLQNYALERLLERVSLSQYKDNFILKGGFLIASMVGLDFRATMDIDATITSLPVSEETMRKMVTDIIRIDLDDGFSFELKYIQPIRDDDEYQGLRVALSANYPPMAIPIKLDITTGDKLTPRQIEYSFSLMFENRSIQVMSYNLSTILAEKLETIISRGDQNTRMRDYYDVYILATLQSQNIQIDALAKALTATVRHRGSLSAMTDYQNIMNVVRASDAMNRLWKDYRRNYEYATEIPFEDACSVVSNILDGLMIDSGTGVFTHK